jgi:hypothetical protein
LITATTAHSHNGTFFSAVLDTLLPIRSSTRFDASHRFPSNLPLAQGYGVTEQAQPDDTPGASYFTSTIATASNLPLFIGMCLFFMHGETASKFQVWKKSHVIELLPTNTVARASLRLLE